MTANLLFLGRSSSLAQAELRSFFPDFTLLSPDIVSVPQSEIQVNGTAVPLSNVLSVIAGTVKIAEVLDTMPACDPVRIAKAIRSRSDPEKPVTFGISYYGRSPVKLDVVLKDVKDLLSGGPRSVRYVRSRDGSALSAVVIKNQDVTDIDIVESDGTFIIAKTIAVQEFEEWGKRDYGRPYADPKAGMLPPKIARMIVNIALGPDASGKTLWDPFCGMGTILGEAWERGATVIGSDADPDAVTKCRKNMEWLSKDTTDRIRVFASDATHISSEKDVGLVDAVVTEPYMGPTKLGEHNQFELERSKNIFKGLVKLYIGCLREWSQVLKPEGHIMMALPTMVWKNREYTVKKIIDMCENLGYTKVLGPLPYSRPGAIIRREFYLFRKN